MKLWTAAVLCSAAAAFFSAVITSANDIAISGELSAQRRAQIDDVFKEYDTPVSPGCAVGVMRNGHLAYARGFGLADLERGVRITPATLFDLASTSKQFTAGAVLLLAQDGKLSLSDAVRKYVPELPDYGAPITIDHLIRHTSGLRDYIPQMSLIGLDEAAVSNEQTLALIARQRQLNFPSGSRYEYSNTGYFLLSVIVKRMSGKSLAEFARERILLPLGMTQGRYQEEYDMIIPGRALGYARDEAGGFRHSVSNWEQTGDGSLHLSIEELLQWDRNFYHPRVGGQAFIERLQEPGTLANGEAITYARGLVVDEYRGLARVQHGGAWSGYNSMYARFPEQHTSVAVLCNLEGGVGNRADQVSDIVLADVLHAAEPATASQQNTAAGSLPHQRLVGSYLEAEDTTVFNVVEKEGKLTLMLSSTALPLTPLGRARFAVQGSPATAEFSIPHQGPASSLRLQLGGGSVMTAARITPATPSADDLQAYAGTFYSPELDVTWSIVIENGHLAVQRETRKFVATIEPLEPATTDVFFHEEPGVIRFTRAASGRLSGFELSSWGRRGIRFAVHSGR